MGADAGDVLFLAAVRAVEVAPTGIAPGLHIGAPPVEQRLRSLVERVALLPVLRRRRRAFLALLASAQPAARQFWGGGDEEIFTLVLIRDGAMLEEWNTKRKPQNADVRRCQAGFFCRQM
jgi:hypothetical protein